MTFNEWVAIFSLSSNLVIAGAAVLQVILLYCTFHIGGKYLSQHRHKYMLENRLKLIEATLKDIKELLAVYEQIFSVRYSLQEKLKKDNDYSTFRSVLIEFWRKNKRLYPDKVRLKSQISINVNLINDPKLDLLVKKCQQAELYLYHPYLYLRRLPRLEDQEIDEDLFRVLPFSLYQRTRSDTKDFIDAYQNLLKELKSFYFKP